MRKFKINSASVSPGRYEQDTDDEFMEDLSSVITLEDGSSLNLKRAVLLYDPDSHKIKLTDSSDIPNGFVQVATMNVTKDEPEDAGPPPELFGDIPESVESEGEDVEPEPEDTDEPDLEPSKESGEFFQ